jgi:hypothetical protein
MAYGSNASSGMFVNWHVHSWLLIGLCCSFISLFPIAAKWWAMFDGDTRNLQKLALRFISQCCSSSGCERNWSTFSLIHTKVRNRLSYKKLHKLVYVNYNLCICLRQAGLYKREEDPFDKLIELSLYDAQNLIRDWMEHGRSNMNPLLDKEDTQSDTPPRAG